MRRSSHTSLLRDFSHSTLCRSSPAHMRQLHVRPGALPDPELFQTRSASPAHPRLASLGPLLQAAQHKAQASLLG